MLYRPFDTKHLFYNDMLIERSRKEVMKHMMKENFGLNVVRQFKKGESYSHVLVSNTISESCYLSNSTSEIGYVSPLYLYDDPIEVGGVKGGTAGTKYQMSMVLEPEKGYTVGRKANIAKPVWDAVTDIHGKFATPENIFYYIYAVLYAPKYRKKYAEFLKTDFPRVPFTSDKSAFKELAEYGEVLTEMHLMKSKKLLKPTAKCEGKGDFKVEKLRYEPKEKRVYINSDQYFSGVAPEVWEYHIGGYQVPEKWLKDRKGRALSSDDIRHYCLIITVLEKTIEIQSELDPLFDAVEKNVIPIQW
ncbi:MAG TPA: hypothetical protein PKU71_16335 [bacterium]|nr:hypothetical protein [bacterium]